MEPGQEQAAGLLVGSPPQDPPPCSCAGRQRERLLHQSAAKAGGRGQHGMRPGGSSSTLLGCHLPLPPKSLLLQQQMQPGIHSKKDNGQGAVQPKRLGPGVTNHCCPQISRMDRTESDEAGLSANPAQIMSSFLRIGPITAAMGLIHGLMTKDGSN